MSTAVVLLSGGLDSTTTLAIARREHIVHAMSFRYGQRHGAGSLRRCVAWPGAVARAPLEDAVVTRAGTIARAG